MAEREHILVGRQVQGLCRSEIALRLLGAKMVGGDFLLRVGRRLTLSVPSIAFVASRG